MRARCGGKGPSPPDDGALLSGNVVQFSLGHAMTTSSRFGIFGVIILVSLAVLPRSERVSARQAVVRPGAEDVRFELIGNEPIAGPDGRALVRGWSVLVFRDRHSARCYVAFKHESAIAVESEATCPK